VIQFTYPWALLSLFSIPAILILYSLRPTRRTLLLSTTALWREALRERQRGLGLQKLLRNLSLLMLLLFALVVSIGLADPRWLTRSAEQDDAVLVLDVSASMKTRVGGSTRFDRAKRQAADLIGKLPRGGRMLIMTSGRDPVLRSAFESDTQTLLGALSGLEPSDEAGRPREALALALSLLRNRESGRVTFLTDGAFDESVDFGAARIEFRSVAGPGRNVAITRFDLRPEVGAEDRFQVLLTVRNYTGEEVSVPATVTLDRKQLFQRRLRLPPGARKTLVLPFRGVAAGVARAKIDVDDDLAADNQAFAVMGADEALHVLLFTKGNFYLESVVSALPNVVVTKLDAVTADSLPRQARVHDLVVFDRIAAPSLPSGNYLLIDTVAPGLPFAEAGSVDHPAIEGKGDSALVRHLDLTGIRVDEARRVAIVDESPGLQRLFWSKETELALALLRDDVRLVFLGFDLSRSNFPLQAAFPLFFRQSLAWLHPRGSRFASTQLAAGEPYAIQVPANQSDLILRTPSGEGFIYPVNGGQVLVDSTSESGIYRYTVAQVHKYFAVNLTDERESDINARAELPGEPAALAQAGVLGRVVLPLWPYLAGIALLILALEWCLWCARRSSA
jgi:hypothetical protein